MINFNRTEYLLRSNYYLLLKINPYYTSTNLNYESSNVAFCLNHKKSIVEDDLKTVIFDLTITYENKIINDEFAIFSHKIYKLNNLTSELNEIDYYFYDLTYHLQYSKVLQKISFSI